MLNKYSHIVHSYTSWVLYPVMLSFKSLVICVIDSWISIATAIHCERANVFMVYLIYIAEEWRYERSLQTCSRKQLPEGIICSLPFFIEQTDSEFKFQKRDLVLISGKQFCSWKEIDSWEFCPSLSPALARNSLRLAHPAMGQEIGLDNSQQTDNVIFFSQFSWVQHFALSFNNNFIEMI